MSRRALAGAVAAGIGAIALLAWWLVPRGPQVVAPGQPLPMNEKVEMRFTDEDGGKAETWKLQKRETTREDVVPEVRLPEPDPAATSHAPDDSARALDGQALEAWKQGQIDHALALFEQSIAADPDDRVPRSHYGRLLTLMTDYDRALPQLERAAALSPEDPQVWLDLQSLYERAGLFDQGYAARERADELAAGRPISQNEMGLYEVEGAPSFP
jgi:tetratricopeptide (TPR) repeat protein